jgi:multidrug efflux pump subunit AcrA (membrane-fusion protein)
MKKKIRRVKTSKLYKKISRFIPTIILLIIVGVVCFLVGKKVGLNTDTSTTNTKIENVAVEKRTISKTLTSAGEIDTAKTAKLSLSTSYYYSSLFVEENDTVKKGEKILKYTNGTYLKAPYDLVVTGISVPDSGSKATSSHYIEVKRTDKLIVSVNVNESEIYNIALGNEAEITLTSDSSKTYKGKITKISSVANYSSSGSTFPIEISLTNDGNIKIGMSVSCTINIEELKDVLAVPINAVQINGSRKYVVVVDGSSKKEVDVTTGLSDSDYVEIKSGLTGDETVQVVTVTKQNTIRSNSGSSSGRSGMPNMPGGSGSGMPSMPSGFSRDSGSSSGSNRPSMGN